MLTLIGWFKICIWLYTSTNTCELSSSTQTLPFFTTALYNVDLIGVIFKVEVVLFIFVQLIPPSIEDNHFWIDPVEVPRERFTLFAVKYSGHWIDPGTPEIEPARLNASLVIETAEEETELLPHKLLDFTVIFPEVELALNVIELVLSPLTIVHPAG